MVLRFVQKAAVFVSVVLKNFAVQKWRQDMEENRNLRENRGVHKVYLNGRRTAVMSGVRDVLSFDAKEVYLETEQGILLIKGDELHVNRLSLEKGEVDVDGRIDSFAYSDKNDPEKKAASFLGRIFQ